MSDFDERLTAVLTAASGTAPDAAGLAQAARRRHVVRRRRRIAVGGVAAVLAIAAPVAVVVWLGGDGGGDDRHVTDQTSTSPTPASLTIETDNVRVQVPGDWREFTCSWGEDQGGGTYQVWGPDEDDACGYRTALAFYGAATFDPVQQPDVVRRQSPDGAPAWGGYVYSADGETAVWVVTPDRNLTTRILHSVE